jgi:hypothetical protein
MSSRISRGTWQASARQGFVGAAFLREVLLGAEQDVSRCIAIGVFGVSALDAPEAAVIAG